MPNRKPHHEALVPTQVLRCLAKKDGAFVRRKEGPALSEALRDVPGMFLLCFQGFRDYTIGTMLVRIERVCQDAGDWFLQFQHPKGMEEIFPGPVLWESFVMVAYHLSEEEAGKLPVEQGFCELDRRGDMFVSLVDGLTAAEAA